MQLWRTLGPWILSVSEVSPCCWVSRTISRIAWQHGLAQRWLRHANMACLGWIFSGRCRMVQVWQENHSIYIKETTNPNFVGKSLYPYFLDPGFSCVQWLKPHHDSKPSCSLLNRAEISKSSAKLTPQKTKSTSNLEPNILHLPSGKLT